MPKIEAKRQFEKFENKVSATSNTGFSRKGLNRDVLVFGVSGGAILHLKFKKLPPRSNSTPVMAISPVNTRF
jgi:hypothetical protein